MTPSISRHCSGRIAHDWGGSLKNTVTPFAHPWSLSLCMRARVPQVYYHRLGMMASDDHFVYDSRHPRIHIVYSSLAAIDERVGEGLNTQ